MMYGTLNTDRLCSVLEQIFAERDNGLKAIVELVDKEAEREEQQKEETA